MDFRGEICLMASIFHKREGVGNCCVGKRRGKGGLREKEIIVAAVEIGRIN